MKKLSLLLVFAVFLVFGFSFSNQSKEKTTDKSTSKLRHETSPFVIKSIESEIVSFHENSSEKPLKGVVYSVVLYSHKDLTGQLSSLKFEMKGDTPIEDAMVYQVAPLMIDPGSSKGYTYHLQFETYYRDNYTDEELQTLKKDRNFRIFLQKEDNRIYIPLENKQ